MSARSASLSFEAGSTIRPSPSRKRWMLRAAKVDSRASAVNCLEPLTIVPPCGSAGTLTLGIFCRRIMVVRGCGGLRLAILIVRRGVVGVEFKPILVCRVFGRQAVDFSLFSLGKFMHPAISPLSKFHSSTAPTLRRGFCTFQSSIRWNFGIIVLSYGPKGLWNYGTLIRGVARYL